MLEALREMGGQGSTGEIAQRIHARKGFEEEALKAVHHGLDAVLHRAASSGLLVKVGRNESGNLWKLADLAQFHQALVALPVAAKIPRGARVSAHFIRISKNISPLLMRRLSSR